MTGPRTIKNRYAIESELGRGPYATTYLVKDEETGESCCLKEVVLAPAAAADVVRAFQDETSDLERLEHPRVPAFRDCLTVEGEGTTSLCLITDYVRGKSLKQLVEEGKRFSAVEALRIALDVVLILQYMQALKPPLLHRDLRPSNVLMSGDRKIYLTDFAAVNDVMRLHAKAAGTVPASTTAFMPPEQLAGSMQPSSDTYALGAILLYLLSGKSPTDFTQVNGEIDFPPHVHVTPAFKGVLATMLKRDWRQRYKNPSEIREALEALLVPKSVDKPAASRFSPRLAVLAVTALALLAYLVARG